MPGLIVAPLVLAAVFALSAVAKLADKSNSTFSVMQLLRLPKVIVRPVVARALPWGELALAAALLLMPGGVLMKLAALAALALTLTYWVIVARAMTFKPRPVCGCFGRIGDQRITAKTVVRNTLLVAFAVTAVVFAFRDRAVISGLADLSKADWSWLGAVVATGALAVLISAGSTGTEQAIAAPSAAEQPLSGALEGEVVHGSFDEEVLEYQRAAIPHTLLIDPDGKPHTLAELALHRAQLLVFVNCTCASTHQTADLVPQWSDRLSVLNVRFIIAGLDQLEIAQLGAQTPELFWRDYAGVASATLGANLGASPAAVLLGADGMLAGGPVFGVDAVSEFVDEIEEQLGLAFPEQPGESA